MSETLGTEALMPQVYAAADEARHWPKTFGALGGALGGATRRRRRRPLRGRRSLGPDHVLELGQA